MRILIKNVRHCKYYWQADSRKKTREEIKFLLESVQGKKSWEERGLRSGILNMILSILMRD